MMQDESAAMAPVHVEPGDDGAHGVTPRIPASPLDGAPSRERGWRAELALRFARDDATTRLVSRRHCGPLVVQKALHPEGPEVCQAIVVHPPGGIAGGDALSLALDVGPGAHVQIATPGASRWYRTTGATARQDVVARIGAGASLEWLPQEAIVFDGARARLATRIELEGDAAFVGWDVIALGRTASGERFTRGDLRQRFEVVRDGALLWADRARIEAGDRLLDAPAGLDGHAVSGTFVVAAPAVDDALVARCRALGSDLASGDRAITGWPGMMLARCRASDVRGVRAWLAALWSAVRPGVLGREARAPRLWST